MALGAVAAGLLGLEPGRDRARRRILVPRRVPRWSARSWAWVRPPSGCGTRCTGKAPCSTRSAAIIAVIAFYGVMASSGGGVGGQAGQFVLSCVGTGVAGGIVGTAGAVAAASRRSRWPQTLSTPPGLAVVAAVAAGCDALSPATGIIAAASSWGWPWPTCRASGPRRGGRSWRPPVQLVRDVLLLSVAATVTPRDAGGPAGAARPGPDRRAGAGRPAARGRGRHPAVRPDPARAAVRRLDGAARRRSPRPSRPP